MDLIPIIVGITGNRVIPDDAPSREYLRDAVRKKLSDLSARFPNSPKVFLSPLASGADQLCAEAAMDAGFELRVPLPMPEELYLKDFVHDVPGRKSFTSLMARSSASFVVPLVEGLSWKAVSAPGPERDQQYAMVGAYVIRHSHILLTMATHDNAGAPGVPKVGGALDIIRMAREGVRPPYGPLANRLSAPQRGLMYHFWLDSLASPGQTFPETEPFGLSDADAFRATEQSAEAEYFKILRDLDLYNRDATRWIEPPSGAPKQHWIHSVLQMFWRMPKYISRKAGFPSIEESEASFFPESSRSELEQHSGEARRRLHAFAVADAMCVFFQQRVDWHYRMVLWCAGSGLAIILLVELVLTHLSLDMDQKKLIERVAMLTGTILFLTAYAFYSRRLASTHKHSRKHDASPLDRLAIWVAGEAQQSEQNRYEDYRSLAEAIRIQIAWDLAGLPFDAADRYLRLHSGEVEWIRKALRALNVPGLKTTRSAERRVTAGSLRLATMAWIRGQASFFGETPQMNGAPGLNRKKVRKHQEERLEQFIEGLFRLEVILILVRLVVFFVPSGSHEESENPYVEAAVGSLSWLIAALVILLGCLERYRQSKQYGVFAGRYAQMDELFMRALKELPPLEATAGSEKWKRMDETGRDKCQSILEELAEEALAENGDWLMMNRTHGLTIPE